MFTAMQGKVPSLMELIHLHNVVVNAVDLHMPVHLSDQLTGSTLNEDVKQSIMELLQGPSTTSNANLRRGSLYSVDSTPIQKWVMRSILHLQWNQLHYVDLAVDNFHAAIHMSML